jgi:mannose-6-phosphate isomerase-like protein (cupin superfamily)
MEKVSIEDIEPLSPLDENIPDDAMADSVGGARQLSEPLDISGLSISYYELAPGESFTVSSHRHSVQEEVFYIQSGTVTFETENEDMMVDAGEVLRVPPGTFQLGTNREDERVTALALGAPREYEGETHWLIDCGECDGRTPHVFEELENEGAYVYRCTDCSTESYRFTQ